MDKIKHNNQLIAIKIRKFKKGITSPTNPNDPLQIVIHNRLKGSLTKAHIHSPNKRTTQKLQECLVVIKGKIKIDLYNTDGKFFKSTFVSRGQAVMFISGGHAVHILQNTEILEIKNGPYIEDKILI